MLLQHILTKDIFLRVFAEDQFHSENNIARELDKLEGRFFVGDTRRQAIDRLRAYYGAIGRAADEIADYSEKQSFLKAIYEDFYKAYNPAAADRLGVVYTPNEIVDFMIRGTDYLLQKHFGRSLADRNVQILDPATGTGTFITNLIEYLPEDKLEYKYLNELHANEVAILPYYIANLNIEYTYREKTGRYLEFPNLVFVDTLDNTDWKGATGGAVERQSAFELGGLSFDNWYRMQQQNEKTISVIIGNPPYNATQRYWNDFNPNRTYPEIDERIRETYVRQSSARNLHKQYDMYKRFVRWASDRLADDGVVGFITNRAYIDARQDDGFRKVVSQEFSDIYILDLGSDVRRNPKISGTTHNVFGIQTGVAIGFFVREEARLGECGIHYAQREDTEIAADTLAYLNKARLDDIEFERITPDKNDNWLNRGNADFERLLSLADRQTKSGGSDDDGHSIFSLRCPGVVTARDEWVYDFSPRTLVRKALYFSNTYNELLDAKDSSYPTTIKWSRNLRRHFLGGRRIVFSRRKLTPTLFRPFVKKPYFADVVMSNDLTGNHYTIFGADLRQPNKVICYSGPASSKPFQVLAVNNLMGFDTLEKTQCLPLYRYTEDGERVSNITDWGLKVVNDHYRKEFGRHFEEVAGGESITAEDIFAYTYAVLHDPVYRYDYKNDLLREFPRLPLYHDFDVWRNMGRELLDLHIGFEDAEPYPLERHDTDKPATRVMLRANKQDKERGIIRIDDRTTLSGVPESAWRYMLGNRSALEWVLDQYKEKKPRDPTIREKFNTYKFADYKERVIDLLMRVCTVSVKTMEIVDGMAYWEDGYLIVFGDRDKHEWAAMGLRQSGGSDGVGK